MTGQVYMQTGAMAGYQAPAGPQNSPKERITSFMEEGKYYADRDDKASQALDKYVTEANTGLEAYTNTAHTHVQRYLSNEAYNVQQFNSIHLGERPREIPDVLRVDGRGFERP
jgi:hypothetical protein